MGKKGSREGKKNKKTAKEAGKRDQDEHSSLNAHGQHGYNDAYFLLDTRDPRGPTEVFCKSKDQALDYSQVEQLLSHSLPIRLSSHKNPDFCYCKEY